MENVRLEVQLPRNAMQANLTPSQGKYRFETASKLLTWEVGRIDPSAHAPAPALKGQVPASFIKFSYTSTVVDKAGINAYTVLLYFSCTVPQKRDHATLM